MTLTLRYAALSDIGRVRKKNEDAGYAGSRLLVQADGMGGPPAGDLASALTVQTMRRLEEPFGGDAVEALAGAVHRANDRLSEMVESDPSIEGMGTTLDALLLDGHRAVLAHIGDSRAYLLRNGQLSQLTSDHTFVQTLVDEGRITLAEARIHPHRSLMIRALDGRSELDPDIASLDVQLGDRLLLCSDGLSGFIEDESIRELMGLATVDAAAVSLVRAALDAGSNDNVTCVLGEVTDEDTAPGGPLLVGAAAEQVRPPGSGTETSQQPPLAADEAGEADDDRDPEELRYAPLAPRRFRWLRRLIAAVVVLAVVVLGLNWVYDWTQRQYYVGAHDGRVAIFRGLDGSVAGYELSDVYEETTIDVSVLSDYWQNQVEEGIEVDNLDSARETVTQLQSDVSPPTPTEPTSPRTTGPTSPPTTQPDRQGGGNQQGGGDRQGRRR